MSVECRATVFLLAWHTGKESVKGTRFQDWSTSSSFDVRKMLGCCGQVARRWHCLGAQVFVFLSKDKGDSLKVTPLTDEKKVRPFTACDDVYAWWPDSRSGAERQWTTLSQLVWQDKDLTRLKCCILDRFWTFSTSLWENIVDAADLSQSTCCRLGQHQCGKAYHLRVNAVSQARMHKFYSLPSDWQKVHVDMTVSSFFWPWITVRNCFQKSDHQQALWCRWRTRLKTGQIFDIGFFGIKACDWARPHSAGSGVDDYVWRKQHGFLYNNTGIRNSRKQVFLASEKR